MVTNFGARVSHAAFKGGSAVARSLPGPVAIAAGRAMGRGLALPLRDRRRMVARHMRRVHGPGLRGPALWRAVDAVFDSYGRYWAELFRLAEETPESIDAGMTIEGLDNLAAARAKGHGAILAAPHMGGWDWGGAFLAVRGFEPVAVVEELEPPEVFQWFRDVRERLGMEIIPANASAGPAVLQALKSGRTLGLVADRDILGSGVEVEFFGETTTLPVGPATLALRTGAPLLPCAIYFRGRNGHHAEIRRPMAVERTGKFRADVTRLTQALAHELEDFIRAAPDQWHLVQPNWPSDREALRRRGWRARPERPFRAGEAAR